MRIFKNRGAIYFSKSNKKKSNEQKILIIALVAIVCFTVFFLLALGISNDFSAKKFFAPDETLSALSVDDEQPVVLPQVSGKSNLVNIITNDDNLLFVSLVQIDMDNVSYKVATLKPETEIEGVSLFKTYQNGGSENVKNAVESLLSVEFDYFVQMDSDDFADFYDDLGRVNYAVADDIRHKSDNLGVTYSVNIKAGEQSLSGTQVVNLVRYYLETNNTSGANDVILNCWQQQINAENYENGERIFADFIAITDTNISVRDFSAAGDEFTVLTNESTGVGAYSAVAEYDGNTISEDNLQQLRGYFVK